MFVRDLASVLSIKTTRRHCDSCSLQSWIRHWDCLLECHIALMVFTSWGSLRLHKWDIDIQINEVVYRPVNTCACVMTTCSSSPSCCAYMCMYVPWPYIWMHVFACVVTRGSGGVHVCASTDEGQTHPPLFFHLLHQAGLSIKPRTHQYG